MSYPIEVGKVSILDSGDGTYDVACTRCLSFVRYGEYLTEPEAWQRALACADGFRHDCSDVKEDSAAEVAWRALAEADLIDGSAA